MTDKIAIHKGKEKFSNSLWWRPFFDWQKQMSDALQNISPALIPLAPVPDRKDFFVSRPVISRQKAGRF